MDRSPTEMYSVYILECADGTLYVGIARNVTKRLAEHRKGTGARYTRQHKPLRIMYTEKLLSRSDALKREHQLKGWTREKKIALIERCAPT